MLTAVTEAHGNHGRCPRTTSSSAVGHENGQRHIGTPQEEETATAAVSDPWIRIRSPKGSPSLMSEALESGSHLRMTEKVEGPVWFGMIGIRVAMATHYGCVVFEGVSRKT